MSRATLIPFEEEHLEKVLGWVNDPFIRDAIGTIRPIGMAEHRVWFDGLRSDRTKLYMVIRDADDDPVGMIGLNGIDLAYRNAELWLYLGEAGARRQGLGRAAVRAMLALAFETLGLHRVYAHVFDYNDAALGFFERCGFRREGCLREAAFKRGKFCDKHVLGILEGELARREEA